MSTWARVLQVLTVGVLLAACGSEVDQGEVSQSSAASGGAENHGTLEFEGVTYEFEFMHCREGRWHGSSRYVTFRVNAISGAQQDWDRYNLTLTLNPSGEPGPDSENWRMVFGAAEWQADAKVTDAGIRGNGVIHPAGETNFRSVDDERVRPIAFDMRC